ncbi:MAG: SurA N-terminal domain-containing protein, partial [Chloroflexota bacterium]
MAKKRNQEEKQVINRRQTRKEALKSRKLNEQNRQVQLGVLIVAGLILAILVFAGINEWLIQPSRAVANVNGEEITLSEWQNRVRYERAQLIILLENQLEAFGGDVGIIQQFSGQAIGQLLDEDAFGQGVLDAMVDETIIRQAAADRGITVTEADIDAEIGGIYNFFDGDVPTPMPAATETIMPTPSLTPIPTQVITELLPTLTPFPTATMRPTGTPAPTATAVSQESFDEQYSEFLARLDAFNTNEASFRSTITQSLYRERLADAIAEEEELSTMAPHASYFNITFGTEEEANEALALIEADGYLTVWNTIRSLPFDPESTDTGDASEVVWRTQDS